MRVIQISDSQLSTWYFCRRRYQLERLQRYRLLGSKPDHMQEGSIIHKMLETFYKLGIPQEDKPSPSYSDRIEAGLQAANDHATLTEDIDISGERLQFLKDSFVTYADFWKNDGWTPLATERYFTVELYKGEDIEGVEGLQILYEGIVDLMVLIAGEEGVFPVDHKSSRSFKTIRHASVLSGQFIGYATALNTTKVIENKFGLQTSYDPPQRFIRHPITYDQHVLDEWKAWTIVQAMQMDTAAQNDYYEPNYFSCVRNCPFTSACYTRESLRAWKLAKDYIQRPPSDRKVYKAYDSE